MFNVGKYKAWLDINQNTPFPIKLLVLETGALSTILYGCETWGNLQSVSKKLMTIELSLLKYALGVKQGTPYDLVYQELNRGDVIAKIKDRQELFIQKFKNLTEEEAVVKCVWDKNTNI